MRWLHLSDIHFAPAKDGLLTKNIREALPRYLEQLENVDEIFFCGDLRHALLNKDDKDAAKNIAKYLLDIAKSAGVTDEDHIHIVPGNHDLDRGNQKKVKNVRGIRDKYQYAYGRIDEMSSLLSRFEFFNEAIAHIYPNNSSCWSDSTTPSHRYRVFQNFVVVYINTAIASCEDDERGSLVIGSYDIDKVLKEASEHSNGKPIIVLGHHTTLCFEPNERRAIHQLFRKYGILFYLVGDEHDGWAQTIGTGIPEITSGCIKYENNTNPVFLSGSYRKTEI